MYKRGCKSRIETRIDINLENDYFKTMCYRPRYIYRMFIFDPKWYLVHFFDQIVGFYTSFLNKSINCILDKKHDITMLVAETWNWWRIN